MTDLNERGLKDGLVALTDVRRTVEVRMREAQRRAGEAEAEMLAMQKIFGFVDQQIGEHRARLETLQAQKEGEQ